MAYCWASFRCTIRANSSFACDSVYLSPMNAHRDTELFLRCRASRTFTGHKCEREFFSQILLSLKSFHCACISYSDLFTTSSSAFRDAFRACRLYSIPLSLYPLSPFRFSSLKAYFSRNDKSQSKEKTWTENDVHECKCIYHNEEIEIIIAKNYFA